MYFTELPGTSSTKGRMLILNNKCDCMICRYAYIITCNYFNFYGTVSSTLTIDSKMLILNNRY